MESIPLASINTGSDSTALATSKKLLLAPAGSV